jgi:hypothetical protein
MWSGAGLHLYTMQDSLHSTLLPLAEFVRFDASDWLRMYKGAEAERYWCKSMELIKYEIWRQLGTYMTMEPMLMISCKIRTKNLHQIEY